MLYNMFHGKIHRATVTEANLEYMGSITIDSTLMKMAGILPGERVQIVDNNNGNRLETYVIEGEPDSGVICLNGAAARKVTVGDKVIITVSITDYTGSVTRKVTVGDKVIIIAYAMMTPEEAASCVPKVVMVDDENRPLKVRGTELAGEIG